MDHASRSISLQPIDNTFGVETGSASERAAVSLPVNRIEAILDRLGRGERFLVCSHMRPDGDAVGSMLAVGMLLKQLGKRADLVTADRIPRVHRGLPGVEEIRIAERVEGEYDAAILLECDGLERTRLLGLKRLFLINIDHHATGREYADLNWIDRGAASVGELVYRLAKAAGVTVTPEMATCLYTTLLTDTGGFCYGSTQASTFGLAQELVLAGADPIRIAHNVYFSTPTSKLLLLGAALGNLKHEDRLAWLWVTLEDMARTYATEDDCEGIVNFALCASGVEAAVFLREMPDQRIQLSLRSKGRVNVAGIAERLGGGGHESAAGCTLLGPLERALNEILDQLRPCVDALAVEAGS
ncbi:MAG: bifunctional oligoribonuclease/PAP phosphatase NrnA [Terracidiphilus sp.]|jgi:phosphoesterase RecJ-like protein